MLLHCSWDCAMIPAKDAHDMPPTAAPPGTGKPPKPDRPAGQCGTFYMDSMVTMVEHFTSIYWSS